MLEHLPALQVVLPLMAAPVAALCRWRNSSWLFTLGAMWAAFAISILLFLQVMEEGTIRYFLGGWVAPWGIEYRVDKVSA